MLTVSITNLGFPAYKLLIALQVIFSRFKIFALIQTLGEIEEILKKSFPNLCSHINTKQVPTNQFKLDKHKENTQRCCKWTLQEHVTANITIKSKVFCGQERVFTAATTNI